MFNLQTVTARIKARTEHLKGVKIAIMGCIVNGPGEMADADFGYVGGAPKKINLYVGKTPMKFNIPETEAVDRLVDLIREHGKWVEPEPASTPESFRFISRLSRARRELNISKLSYRPFGQPAQVSNQKSLKKVVQFITLRRAQT